MALRINHFYRFGEFTLDTDQRLLLRDGKPLPLTPKMLETLLILVEDSGRIVEKEVLMKRLWRDTFVEEANLTFNIQQLRKTLGDNARQPRFIETIPRRGYRFIADVEEVLTEASPVNQHITQRIEIAAAPSPDTNINLSAAMPEARLPVLPASTGVSRKAVALAVGLAIILASGVFMLWKVATSATNKAGDNAKATAKPPVASSLKLEKLTETGQSRQVAMSPDGKYIAYTRTSKQTQSIWLRHLATNSNVEIVPARDRVIGLTFANSGEFLYFVSGAPDFVSGAPATALYRVSLVGGVPTKIVDKLKNIVAISSDDRQIAFIRQVINSDGLRKDWLRIVTAEGTGERALFVGTYPNLLHSPVWSPDEQAIICIAGNSDGGTQDMRIIEVSIANGISKELSAERFFNVSKMVWLPQKSALLLAANKRLEDNRELWRVSYPGMEINRISEGINFYLDLSVAANADCAAASHTTLLSELWVGASREPKTLKRILQARTSFCWTADGRLIFMSTASGNCDLWMIQADGSEQRQLTSNAAIDIEPCVTADNRYIVFLSNRTGGYQVWRMNIDGSNQIQLTRDDIIKRCPTLSPDGQWVVYNTADNWQLWKVSIEGGDPLRLTDYYASHTAVSPDGKLIACVGKGEARRELIIIPFAGGQPLKHLPFAAETSRLQWTPDSRAVIYQGQRNLVQVLLKQPLDGGPTETIMDFEEDNLFDFGYSLDGKLLALIRGAWQHDIMLISNLNHD